MYPIKIIIKTCGTIQLLKSIRPLIRLTNNLGLTLCGCRYTRGSFIFPKSQPFPHLNFKQEVVYIEENFPHNLCFRKASVTPSRLPSCSWHVLSAVDGDHFFSGDIFTVEVCTTGLDRIMARKFFKTNHDSLAAKGMNELAGIDNINPRAFVCDFEFDPCGYSMNGVDGRHVETLKKAVQVFQPATFRSRRPAIDVRFGRGWLVPWNRWDSNAGVLLWTSSPPPVTLFSKRSRRLAGIDIGKKDNMINDNKSEIDVKDALSGTIKMIVLVVGDTPYVANAAEYKGMLVLQVKELGNAFADPPLGDHNKIITSPQNGCPSYEFCAEKFEITPVHHQASACDMCGVSQDHYDGLKLDLRLSSTLVSSEVGPSQPKDELEADEFQDADWSDLTESQLEDLVLSNLDVIFKSAIKKSLLLATRISTKAVLRSGLCYGCKDTVSNIVDNTLAFLRSGQDYHPSRDHCFEDLQQLEKYILTELFCVLREVRPFFSTGDAMWCLLICDMNLSHSCAMDGDPLNGFVGDGVSNGVSFASKQPQLKPEAKTSELNLPNPCRLVPPFPCSHSSPPEVLSIGPNNTEKMKNSVVRSGVVSEKVGTNSFAGGTDKTFSVAGTSQFSTMEEKQGSKGSSRAKLSSLGGLILDKKVKSVSDPGAFNIKSSLKIKSIGADVPQDNGSHLVVNSGPSSSTTFCLDNVNNISPVPKTDVATISSPVNMPPEFPPMNNPSALTTADTELSLSLPTQSNSLVMPPVSCSEAVNPSYVGMPFGNSLGDWGPQDKKDEMILKLVPRVQELQNQLQEWTEWTNQKVMQAARRLKSAASCQEVSKREKKTLMKVQSWERQKTLFQEELMTEKCKVIQHLQELQLAKVIQEQLEDISGKGDVKRERECVMCLSEKRSGFRPLCATSSMRSKG
ncbi:S-adenosylmethionine decarboxylase proenzyme 4 [Hibiscus syriacus]|uniref:S-adenosylmethionine decarboxylase proenzyme 4 n=1 Tax=Hibiscus syriacus TaxID=106335 RepID=A0A6A3C354_HIBSY|nr:S-adenosylmethionine decarboxylase proenzyme 4 [Hibiscus syriacus]